MYLFRAHLYVTRTPTAPFDFTSTYLQWYKVYHTRIHTYNAPRYVVAKQCIAETVCVQMGDTRRKAEMSRATQLVQATWRGVRGESVSRGPLFWFLRMYVCVCFCASKWEISSPRFHTYTFWFLSRDCRVLRRECTAMYIRDVQILLLFIF